jgi:hypothetical protein
MGNDHPTNVGKAAYVAPALRKLDATEVITKLLNELDGPLGSSARERIAKAAEAIRHVLGRLPESERDDALQEVIGGSERWLRRAEWSR